MKKKTKNKIYQLLLEYFDRIELIVPDDEKDDPEYRELRMVVEELRKEYGR